MVLSLRGIKETDETNDVNETWWKSSIPSQRLGLCVFLILYSGVMLWLSGNASYLPSNIHGEEQVHMPVENRFFGILGIDIQPNITTTLQKGGEIQAMDARGYQSNSSGQTRTNLTANPNHNTERKVFSGNINAGNESIIFNDGEKHPSEGGGRPRSPPKKHSPPKKRTILPAGVFADELDNSLFIPEEMHASLKQVYNIVSDGTNLWDDPKSKLPEWIKAYLNWHKQRVQEIHSPKSLKTHKFLAIRCTAQDRHCGGVSDRLKPLPLMLRFAYYTKRILLIYWDRPGALEEFLVPPQGGMDWRVPQWMRPLMKEAETGVIKSTAKDLQAWTRTDVALIKTIFQDYHGGRNQYDEQLVEGEDKFETIFHELWRLAFTPSQPVRAVIESEMTKLDLVPGSYTGVHLRALYAMEDRNENVKATWARNAVNCASELRPGKQIYFASDSFNATYYARQYAAGKKAVVRVRESGLSVPLHIDKVPDWRKRNISDFYDAFVDLYIMAQSDCLTYNKGGFGIMALYMSRNVDCGLRQDALDRAKIRSPCIWVDDPNDPFKVTKNTISQRLPEGTVISSEKIYVDPMI